MNPRKPIDDQLLRGNPGHRARDKKVPGLRRSDEAPPAPDTLDEEGQREWDRVARDLWEANLLATVDLSILENYCMLASLIRRCRKQLMQEGISVKSKRSAPRQHPAIRTILSSLPLLRVYADSLGIGAKARGQAYPLRAEQQDFFDLLDAEAAELEDSTDDEGKPN
jgi:P27 family predicted phage terminase small subunit